MKNISTTKLVVGALVLSFGLIIGSNIFSSNSVAVIPSTPASGHARSIPTQNADVSITDNSNSVAVGEDSEQIQYAPDFTLKNLAGERVQLSSYRGQKPVVLDFFATWCPNCQRDMPRLSKMYDKYKDEVEVIGVNLRESKRKVERFVTKNNISFPIVMDPLGSVANSYGVRYTNFHVLINKEGVLVGTVPGDISESEIVGLL